MDIQTRKLVFIQEFLKVQSEELIAQLEKVMRSKDFTSFTIDEFNTRIDESMKDSENENVTDSSELLSEIKLWK